MPVFKSSIEKLERDIAQLEADRDYYKREWNALVERINAKGGENFLRYGSIYPTQPTFVPFTDSELRKLLMLCHPDKHDGKELAVEMTKKLNSLRNERYGR